MRTELEKGKLRDTICTCMIPFHICVQYVCEITIAIVLFFTIDMYIYCIRIVQEITFTVARFNTIDKNRSESGNVCEIQFAVI